MGKGISLGTKNPAPARKSPKVVSSLRNGSVERVGQPGQLEVLHVRGDPLPPLSAAVVGGELVAQYLRCGDSVSDPHPVVDACGETVRLDEHLSGAERGAQTSRSE